MATMQTVTKVLKLWRENWPSHEISEATIQLYRLALVDVPDAILERAAIDCLKSCTFWPTVAEVHKMLAAHNRGMTVQEAEGAILEQHPEWADPLERSRAWLAAKKREREARREQAPALQLEEVLA